MMLIKGVSCSVHGELTPRIDDIQLNIFAGSFQFVTRCTERDDHPIPEIILGSLSMDSAYKLLAAGCEYMGFETVAPTINQSDLGEITLKEVVRFKQALQDDQSMHD